MNRTILVTPQSFLYHKKFIQKKYKNHKFKFVKGPINNSEKLTNYLKNVDTCIIGSEKISFNILKDQKKLKTICRFGTNAENIDTILCKKKKIKVIKLRKNINSMSVARHSLALFLLITNNLNYYLNISKENVWKRRKNISPSNIKVGVVGMGNIGKLFTRYVKLLGFKINYFSRVRKNKQYGKYFKNIEKLIKNSDITSFHLPSNEKTKKIFSRKVMKQLKDKIIINTSRGDLFDEKILFNLLKYNYIKFAALDVFKNEPTINLSKKIRLLPNVFSTCHSSFFDDETIEKMVFETLGKLKLEK